jgi:hypothetical protein
LRYCSRNRCDKHSAPPTEGPSDRADP